MVKIDVSEIVWKKIAAQGKFGETEDDVLRRVFKVDKLDNGEFRNQRRRGLLPPEDTKCRFNYKGKIYQGEIKNGKLVLSTLGEFTSLSAASRGVSNTSRDGWYDWYLQFPGEITWVHADDWRKGRVD